ncbi:hypothetical protein BG011_003102 [Mortierella polycephala]|uniref:Uncharacterized protein n=1 Tax=Mortierella polycephala TaxID=41804 RepID=A0A9P6Q4F4_9FUNG|nr:hypothetical protein BG011_003102 [Mortierella polycephala]
MSSAAGVPDHSFSSLGSWANSHYTNLYPDNHDRYYQHQQHQHQQQQQQHSPISPSHHDAPLLSGNVPSTANTSSFRDEQVSQPSDGVEEQKMEQRTKESKRMQRIAADLLAIKKYDYSVMIPRHISQEQDEFFIASEPATKACKHLARSTDIKRAIQFREHAREILFYINGDVRLSRMQGLILGSLVVYNVFNVTIGLAQVCETYTTQDSVPASTSASTLNMESSNTMTLPSLQSESRSIRANRGLIPEAAYQARLWAFWGLYIRDSSARLYLGWPHGMDTRAVNAELPKIEGCIGLGGKRMPQSKAKAAATMAREPRDSSFKRDHILPKIRQAMDTEWRAMTDADRLSYRNTRPISDDDEDQVEGDEYGMSPTGKRTALYGLGNEDFEDDPAGQDREGRFHLLYGADVPPRSRTRSGTVDSRDFSALSSSILKEQSKGHSLVSAFDPQDVNVHMERMKLLLDSENDVTDDGSYCRVLFLKEVGLWSIGRRVALYLANRATQPMSSYDFVMSGSVGSLSPTTESVSQKSDRSPLTDRLSTGPHHEAGRGLEEAWLQDQELQSLQAELIAWDKALPSYLRFRPDVDHCNINHKVNGKMGILVMSYYTITIMLQSAYLPFSRVPSTKSPNRKSDKKAAETGIAIDHDPNTHSNHTGESALSQIPARSRTDVTAAAPTSSPHLQHLRRSQSQVREYLNTPHQTCSQLSNTLLNHVELMLDSYPNWCTIQAKVNHAITAALRVSCLNARLNCNSAPARQEAKAGFKMGTDLFKRLAGLPGPLTITDWPAEEDIQQIMEIEAEFKEMMKNSDEQGSTSDESMGDASAATVAAAAAKPVSSGTVTVAITAEGNLYDNYRVQNMSGMAHAGASQHLFDQWENDNDKATSLSLNKPQ